MPKKKLTQERLKELLNYDPKTGIFTWLKATSTRVKKGSIAGANISDYGYRRIAIDGKDYQTSRLAWLYMEGYLPEYDINHKNKTRHDDRWENLRHVGRQCNVRNCNLSKRNTSGITGVYWDSQKQKWSAEIYVSGKKIHLGMSHSKLNAARARWEAEIKYGFPDCNTTSTAYLYIQSH